MLVSTNTSLRDLRKCSLETHGALIFFGKSGFTEPPNIVVNAFIVFGVTYYLTMKDVCVI